ncbi:MAG: T9SS C-terminal target domain-containing protein, partial [Calditrichaeota bacterium]
GETDRDQVTITVGGAGKNVAPGQELVNLDDDELQTAVPNGIALQAVYPNPFNPDTYILFSLSKTEIVSLNIYDTVGRLIRTLVSGKELTPGPYRYYWDGLDNSGQATSSGVYIFRLRSASAMESRKAVLLK